MRALSNALAHVGLDLEVKPDAAARLSDFIALRANWAKTHNLAGPVALAAPWRTDVVDGLAVCAVLDPSLPMVDVGAGGGIPGLIVAATEPDRPIFLVEPRAKRAAFLRTAVHSLGLANVTVVRARWPLDRPLGPVQVVSRAVVSPETWPALALEGGLEVQGVLRMLAAERPTVGALDIELERWVEYGAATQGPRRVAYWGRRAEPA